MPWDDDSLGTPLTKALKKCECPAEAAATADSDVVAAVRVGRVNWRHRLLKNSGRKLHIGGKALGQIQERLGRTTKKKKSSSLELAPV